MTKKIQESLDILSVQYSNKLFLIAKLEEQIVLLKKQIVFLIKQDVTNKKFLALLKKELNIK